MAVKFPLKMADGTAVGTMEELREHFDLEAVLSYYSNGRLVKWLEDRYYDEEAGKVRALDSASENFSIKLCEILGVPYSEDVDKGLDIGDIFNKNKRYELLKKYTTDENILSKADDIAFTQEELDALVQRIDSLEDNKDGNKVVYLCGEHFIIPRDIGKITYKGINNPKVEFDDGFDDDGEPPEPAKAGIDFQNVNFSFDDYVTEYKDLDDNGSMGWVVFSSDLENNPELAIKIIRVSAEKGSAEAWLGLGECYYWGIGVKKDMEEAIKWYRKAAEQGLEYAAQQLSMLNSIIESEKYIQKYADEQKRLAEQGNADMQFSLGEKYLYGSGFEIDEKEAAKWFRKAAEQGNERARMQLEFLYDEHQEDEIGIKIMEELEALIDKWKENAEQGNRDVISQLSLLSIQYRDNEIGKKAAEVLSEIRK